MDAQKTTGWTLIILLLLFLWWLLTNGLSFLHKSVTTSVQSGIALPGGSQNEPTVTTTCEGC